MGTTLTGMTLAAAVSAPPGNPPAPARGNWSTRRCTAGAPTTVSFDLNTFLLTGRPIAIGQRESMGNPA